VRTAIAAGEVQQVVDEPLECNRLFEHAVAGRGEIGVRGMRGVDFELRPNSRKRCAQFMRGVGDERLLAARQQFANVANLSEKGRSSIAIDAAGLILA